LIELANSLKDWSTSLWLYITHWHLVISVGWGWSLCINLVLQGRFLLGQVTNNLNLILMYLWRWETINFGEMGFFPKFYAFDIIPANLRYVLGTPNMHLHAWAKTITFVEIGLLEILCLDVLPANLRHLLRLFDMFLHASIKTITLMEIVFFFCNFTLMMSCQPTLGTF
jgi:hypothetical protein